MSETEWGGQSLPKTGYVTSDGKDLSEVFLGKLEKATSAAIADSASSADSVNASGIVGLSVPSISGTYVSVSLTAPRDSSATWTAPSDGLFIASSGDTSVEINGFSMPKCFNYIDDTESGSAFFPICKGEIVKIYGASRGSRAVNGSFVPCTYKTEVNDE